jgi:hypothetical protein
MLRHTAQMTMLQSAEMIENYIQINAGLMLLELKKIKLQRLVMIDVYIAKLTTCN